VAVKRETAARETSCGAAAAADAVFKRMASERAAAAERSAARLAGNHRRCAFKLHPPDREIARDIASIDDFPHAQPSPSPIV